MFDSVARDPRQNRRRSGAAVLLASVGFGGALAALLMVRPPVAEASQAPTILSFPAELTVPAAPAPKGGGSPRPKVVNPKKATPPAVIPQREAQPPEVLDSPTSTPEPASAAPEADLGGEGGGGRGPGTGPGVGTGTCTGDCSSGPGGGGGGTVHDVNPQDAAPRVRVTPQWPRAAMTLGLTEARCVARVLMDETGTPVEVTFPDCPVIFQANTRTAALGWRWYPVVWEGQPIRARFDITFQYKR